MNFESIHSGFHDQETPPIPPSEAETLADDGNKTNTSHRKEGATTSNKRIKPGAQEDLAYFQNDATRFFETIHVTEAGEERKLTREEIEQIIATHEPVEILPLKGGQDIAQLVELRDDGSILFKPTSTELGIHRDNIEQETYAQRERAAYVVDKFFNFNLVPETVIREVGGKIGSAQRFIPDTSTAFDASYYIPDAAYSLLALFDFIIWNNDRHENNVLVPNEEPEPEKMAQNLKAIDNSLSFGKEALRSLGDIVGSELEGVMFDERVVERIQEVADSPELQQQLESQLQELLNAKEIEALMARIQEAAWLFDGENTISPAQHGSWFPKFKPDFKPRQIRNEYIH